METRGKLGELLYTLKKIIVLKVPYYFRKFNNYIFKYGLFKEDLLKLLGKNPYYNPNQIISLNEAKEIAEKRLRKRHEKEIEKFVIRDSKSFEDKYAWGIEFQIIDLEVGLGYKDYFIVDKETTEIFPTDYISENGLEILKEYTLKKRKI
jgi:hypothetical protein